MHPRTLHFEKYLRIFSGQPDKLLVLPMDLVTPCYTALSFDELCSPPSCSNIVILWSEKSQIGINLALFIMIAYRIYSQLTSL